MQNLWREGKSQHLILFCLYGLLTRVVAEGGGKGVLAPSGTFRGVAPLSFIIKEGGGQHYLSYYRFNLVDFSYIIIQKTFLAPLL